MLLIFPNFFSRTLVEDLALARTSKEASHIVVLINKAVEALLEGLTPHLGQPVETESLARYRDANLLVYFNFTNFFLHFFHIINKHFFREINCIFIFQVLRALADERAYGQIWTRTRVTAALIEARDNVKYNPDAVDCLIRSGLVHLHEYDKHLASAVDSSNQVIIACNFTKFSLFFCTSKIAIYFIY